MFTNSKICFVSFSSISIRNSRGEESIRQDIPKVQNIFRLSALEFWATPLMNATTLKISRYCSLYAYSFHCWIVFGRLMLFFRQSYQFCTDAIILHTKKYLSLPFVVSAIGDWPTIFLFFHLLREQFITSGLSSRQFVSLARANSSHSLQKGW